MLSLEDIYHTQNLTNDEKQVYMKCVDYCHKNGIFSDLIFPNMKQVSKEHKNLSRDLFDYSIFDSIDNSNNNSNSNSNISINDSINNNNSNDTDMTDDVVYIDELPNLDDDLRDFINRVVEACDSTIYIWNDNGTKLWEDFDNLDWDYMRKDYYNAN